MAQQRPKKTSSRKPKAAPRRAPSARAARSPSPTTRLRRASVVPDGENSSAAPRSGFRLQDGEVEQLLSTGQDEPLLREYFGDREYEQLVELARETRTRSTRGGERVLILPGIMGTKIGRHRAILDDVLWLDPIDIARGRIARLALPGGNSYQPLGVLLLAYLKLKLRLQLAGFDAQFYPFDWRQSILALGSKLAADLAADAHPRVHVVAHSMGGLVMRAALSRLSPGKLGRFIMLGTPNYGSFAPVQALRGQYDLVQKLATLDLANNPVEWAKNVLQTFPGLYDMLPFPEKFSTVDLFDAAAWPGTSERPSAALLQAAKQVHGALAPADERCFLIAGVEQSTVVGLDADENGFAYHFSKDGDGTVPLSMCLLPGVAQTYYVEESHGSLPNNSSVGRALVDLLHRGETTELRDSWNRPRQRSVERRREAELAINAFDERGPRELAASDRREVLREFVAPGAGDSATIPVARADAELGVAGGYSHRFENVVVTRRREHSIEINLALGSISEVKSRAIVLGAFAGVEPAGAARALDEALDGAVKEFTSRRMFSARVGEVFVLPTGRSRLFAESVLFAGLGDFGSFSYPVLEFVAENVIRTFVRTSVEDFAIVLLGAASGRAIEGSLRHMFRGFVRGLIDADGDHTIRRITVCELDPERYQRIKEELYRLASTQMLEDVRVTLYQSELPVRMETRSLAGRAHVESTPKTTYLYVTQEERQSVDPVNGKHSSAFVLRSSLLTAGSKAAVLSGTNLVDPKDIDDILRRFSDVRPAKSWLQTQGQELARLLLPMEIRRGLLAQDPDSPLTVVHDARASKIPWEILFVDDGNGQAAHSGWFPAERGGVSRHYAAANLSVAKWLERRRMDDMLDVLLVVNPTGDLGGTLDEAERLEELAARNQAIRLTQIRERDATRERLRMEFGSGKYDIIHYAGHAFFDPEAPARSGIVCHGDQVLSGADLAQLPRLPALAFFNACEAARVRGLPRKARDQARAQASPARPIRERVDQSVGLAEAFLRGGVANYVGTYWPVGDGAASAFAGAFYGALLQQKSIGTAVQSGRQAAQAESPVDWANYVHYGAADFALKIRRSP
jgi:pimeloyl-ACP methyl ester carboxylesterase